MDTEQEEMQFLGLFGMFRESYNIILTWRKIFSKITLSLIVPLSFVYLIHLEVSDVIFSKIVHNEIALDYTRPQSPSYRRISAVLSKERVAYLLFEALYFILFLVLSLLSTAAVVYAIACAYTGRDLTFPKVMSVVPRVWRRLVLTLLCIVGVAFAYNAAAVIIFFLWVISLGDTLFGFIVLLVLLVVYLAGFVYMTVIWQMASVVTVLEEDYGFKAMVKSSELVKGKTAVAVAIFFPLNAASYAAQVGFEKVVVHGEWIGGTVVMRVGFGVVCAVAVSKLILLGLVIQTVIYFVCKSYHHENIDKSALSDHLQVYLGEYVPLKPKDVQLEHYDA